MAVPALFVITWVSPGIFGLLERVFLGVGFAWLTWLAARLVRDTAPSTPIPPSLSRAAADGEQQ